MKLNNIKKWAAALALALGMPSAIYAAVNSGNPALSALELKAEGRNLIQFQPDQTSYEIEVDDISMVTMSAAPVASDATVSISVNGTPYDNHSLTALDGGENTILYTVTTGSQSRTYTIKVKTPVVERYNHFSWKNATVYFVFTDRFYNGDTSNDKSYHRQRPQGNVPDYATFHGGDIKGLTEKLDYLDRLGVDAIWITAPYEQMHGWTGGKDDAFPHYAFHGYYALDWTYMDRNMGTIDEFRNFVTEAHRRGIRVIMDIVLNHTGYSTLDDCVDYDFGNFNGTPTAGWLPSGSKYTMWSSENAVSFNADSQGKWGNWWAHWVRAFGDRDWGTGAGFAREGGDDHTMSLAGLPDVVTEKSSSVAIPPFLKKKWQQENSGDYLNYRLPDVGNWRQDNQGAPADYIINWLAAWVKEFGIDGFRCDTAKHVELSRWKQLKEACDAALSAWRSSSRADDYAKNWTDKFWMTGECFGWQHGDTGYFTQGGFDSMINFAFNSSEGSQGRTPSVDDWKYYANFCNGGNGHQVLNYVSSHDTGLHRPGDQKKVATMLLLCPGGAQIYYGDETSRGYMNGCPDQSMSTRSDFNWDAVDNDDNKHWQKIGQFRRRNPAVGAGTQTELGSDTYARTFTDGDYSNAVVIKLNTQNGQSYTVSVGNAFQDGAKVMDGYNTAVTGVVSGGKVTMTASGPVLLIEPYGTIRGVDPPTPPRPQAPVVTATPASGTTFTSTLQVSLTSSDGSPIHYTTSGTADASSALYTSPLTLSETTTVSTYVANQAGDRVQSFTYTKTDQPQPQGHYIYLKNTKNWSNPTVWVWNDSENCCSNGTWPGDAMTKEGDLWKWALPDGKSLPTQVIFSNSGNEQSGDKSYVDKQTYDCDGNKVGDNPPTPPTPPTPGENTIYFDNSSSNWQTVKVHYWGGTEASEWPGRDMTVYKDKVYSFTCPEGTTGLVFNNGSGDQSDDLTFVKGHLYDKNGDKGEYITGPQKPSVTFSPAGGNVKGSSSITVTIGNEPTTITASFNGRSLNLSNGSNSVSVSEYLTADKQSAKFSVTASNSVGSTQAEYTFTRDDSQPVYTMTGDWRELSIYQIMVGSFQHGDGGASGYSDMWGPDGHRKNGNLRGVINALDYIKELGMNAIWLTPIFDSTNGMGGEKLQATGYFCTNYFKVDPKFGSEAEFDELIREAHNRGIYVILDGVFGHHGGVSQASPNGKWISTQDNTPNVRGSESGNIQYPGSLDYFKEVIRYWMERGVDGWRLDQCYQVYQGGHNYWNDLRREAEAVANERKVRGEKWGTLAYMVGEDWTGAGGITVTQQDGLKSVMDFDGKDNLVNLGYGVGSIGRFLASDAKTRGYRDDGVNPTIFLSNHDTARVGDVVDVNSSPEKLMTRHAAVAAYSGPTCTYYGDEIGDKSGNGNADNKARTSGRISGFNGNEQKVHDYVAKVFNARKANPALWRGSVERDERGNGLEVITKTDSQTGNKVIVIFSQSDANVSIGGTGVDLINGGNVSGSVSVSAWVPAFIKMN